MLPESVLLKREEDFLLCQELLEQCVSEIYISTSDEVVQKLSPCYRLEWLNACIPHLDDDLRQLTL